MKRKLNAVASAWDLWRSDDSTETLAAVALIGALVLPFVMRKGGNNS